MESSCKPFSSGFPRPKVGVASAQVFEGGSMPFVCEAHALDTPEDGPSGGKTMPHCSVSGNCFGSSLSLCFAAARFHLQASFLPLLTFPFIPPWIALGRFFLSFFQSSKDGVRPCSHGAHRPQSSGRDHPTPPYGRLVFCQEGFRSARK